MGRNASATGWSSSKNGAAAARLCPRSSIMTQKILIFTGGTGIGAGIGGRGGGGAVGGLKNRTRKRSAASNPPSSKAFSPPFIQRAAVFCLFLLFPLFRPCLPVDDLLPSCFLRFPLSPRRLVVPEKIQPLQKVHGSHKLPIVLGIVRDQVHLRSGPFIFPFRCFLFSL